MEDRKACVRIYGQDYTISGERDEKTIIKIAAYGDEKMREISKYFTAGQQGSLAVIAAVNIADEYFEAKTKISELEAKARQTEKDSEHYMKMWDEAKRSFLQYKEEAAKSAEERRQSEEKYRKLEEKCSEFENSYFDLQMENVRLKNELEKLQRNT